MLNSLRNPQVQYTEYELELSLPEALRVIEETVKFLNQKNNQAQQQIRSNKDKENQKIVDLIQSLLKIDTIRNIHPITEYPASIERLEELTQTEVNLLTWIIEKTTGKNIKDYKP